MYDVVFLEHDSYQGVTGSQPLLHSFSLLYFEYVSCESHAPIPTFSQWNTKLLEWALNLFECLYLEI